ncbi:ABC transporter permease subunit [Gordonia jinghuaiqii]|nr:ABC transporter permease subunit [Gordonia jinghuaiqii]
MVILLSGLVALLLTTLFTNIGTFPDRFRLPLGDVVESAADWFVAGGGWLYEPVGDAFTTVFTETVLWLQVFPAPLVAATIVLIAYLAAGKWIAALAVALIAWVLAFDLWVALLETLVLMGLSALVATVIGVAVGVASARGTKTRAVVSVVLDGMQAIPVLVYLLPVLLVFGPGNTSALLVTVIYAVPPAARLTDLGIRSIGANTIESAQSLGMTSWQLLFKVQLPLARPSILAGANQTIMAAMAMAVIAAMIGASGLGQPVWRSLNQLQFGTALEGGIALILLAILLDRSSASVGNAQQGELRKRSIHAACALVVVCVPVLAMPSLQAADFSPAPDFMRMSLRGTVDSAVGWLNVNLGGAFDILVDTIQSFGLDPIVSTLTWLPWPVVVVLLGLIGCVLLGVKGGILIAAGAVFIGLLGMWHAAIATISILGVSVVCAVAIGVPIGIAMSASDRVAATLRPVLDTMQTLPIYLVVIPAVIVVGSGSVAGVLATILYCMPPVIRLTNVAIREVDPGVSEAAESLGVSRWQMLSKVDLPLGSPTILVGVNQTIMLAMAMAVVSAFVGTPGLGSEILVSVARVDLATGIEAGLSMLVLALVADRMLRASISRSRIEKSLESIS